MNTPSSGEESGSSPAKESEPKTEKQTVDDGDGQDVSSGNSITLMDIQVSRGEAQSDNSGMISSITLNDMSNPNCRDGDGNGRSLRQMFQYPQFLNQGQEGAAKAGGRMGSSAIDEAGGNNISDAAFFGRCSSIVSEDSLDRSASHCAASLAEDFYSDHESTTKKKGPKGNRGIGNYETLTVQNRSGDRDKKDRHNNENMSSFDANKAEVFSWNGDASYFSGRFGMSEDFEESGEGRDRQNYFGAGYSSQQLSIDESEKSTGKLDIEPMMNALALQSSPQSSIKIHSNSEQTLELRNGQKINPLANLAHSDCINPRHDLAPISEHRRSSTKSSSETDQINNRGVDGIPAHLSPVTESGADTIDRRTSRGLSLVAKNRKTIPAAQEDSAFDGGRAAFSSWSDIAQLCGVGSKELLLAQGEIFKADICNELSETGRRQSRGLSLLEDGPPPSKPAPKGNVSFNDCVQFSGSNLMASPITEKEEEGSGRRKSRGLSLVEKRDKLANLITHANFNGDDAARFDWDPSANDDSHNQSDFDEIASSGG